MRYRPSVLLLAALFCASMQSRAWEAERMLAAAQQLGARAMDGVYALQWALTLAQSIDNVDCEDFAIAKYFSLLALGMSQAKLRMVYVRAQMGGRGGPTQAHMVLAYYAVPAAEPLILDNLITDVRPASRRPDLEPVFSFNSEGLWQGVGVQAAADQLARLSRWREVLAKRCEEPAKYREPAARMCIEKHCLCLPVPT